MGCDGKRIRATANTWAYLCPGNSPAPYFCRSGTSLFLDLGAEVGVGRQDQCGLYDLQMPVKESQGGFRMAIE